MNNEILKRYLTYVLIGVGLALLPVLQGMGLILSSTVTIWGSIIYFAIVAIGLNVLLGYSGLVSLGTAGFMGVGAYMTAYLTETGIWPFSDGWPFFLSLVVSVLVPTAAGLLVGLVSLRVSGMYLAIATLAVAEILRRVFVEFPEFTGSFQGSRADFPVIFGNLLDRDSSIVFLAILLVILLILTDNFIHSPVGRALLTMRASEPAAQAMGINLLKYKLMAFGLATAYAALGGVLYAHFVRFVFPTDWTLMLSLQIVAVIVIGGTKTILGPVIGSIIVFGVPRIILTQLPIIGDIDGLPFVFNGILIIVVILFYPNGLIYIGHDVRRMFTKKVVTLDE